MPKKKLADLQQEGKKEISESKLERLRKYGFVKGQSGNPAGMPKGTVRLSTAIQAVANRVADKTGLSLLQTLLVTMFIEAIEGDYQAREMLFDRGWGTLVQKNVLMQFNGELLKMAQELGLDANDLRGSPVISGLLQATPNGNAGALGVEETQGAEAGEAIDNDSADPA